MNERRTLTAGERALLWPGVDIAALEELLNAAPVEIVDQLLLVFSRPGPNDPRILMAEALPANLGDDGVASTPSAESVSRARAHGVPVERAKWVRIVRAIDLGSPNDYHFEDPWLRALVERAKGTAFRQP